MKKAMAELSRENIHGVDIQLRSYSDGVTYYKITYKNYLFGNFGTGVKWEDGEMFAGFMKGVDAVEEDIKSIVYGDDSDLSRGSYVIDKILERWDS